MRPYPIELRAAIVEALGAGLSASQAARRFGVSVSSVKRFRARYQKTGDLAPRPSPGRPPRIRRDDALVRRQVAAHPDATLAEHCALWQEQTGWQVSLSTMGRMLVRAGCPRRPKPRVTPRPPPASKKPHTEAPLAPSPPSRSHLVPPERRPYPTDLTDAEWAVLGPLVPPPKSGGRPARNRREILDAIGYVVRTGCAWRCLPHDFPPWQTVYHYFRLWRLDGTWEQIHDALREQARQKAGRAARPSAGIVDSQSVKTTEKGGTAATTASRRSTDASGIC
jgi:transposase